MSEFLEGSLQQYLDRLASGEPTPGGGSAAGLTGAMGAALLCMSARFTVGREKYADFEPAAADVLQQAEALRMQLERLTEEDAVAYGQYRAASALPKETDEQKAERRRALQEATRASAQVPMSIARHCHRLLELAGILARNCNPYLVSDVVVATHFALAGFRSAAVNVRMNLASLADEAFVAAHARELDGLATQATALGNDALHAAYQVMQLPLEADVPSS
jgi:formiminotetrahydrofolate cyclodeaminase